MKIEDLIHFVAKAGDMGKYPASSAQSITAALKIANSQLQPGEELDTTAVEQHVDDLLARYVNTQAQAPRDTSLQSYRSRILRAVSDFGRYGARPIDMPSSSRRGSAKKRPAGSSQDDASGHRRKGRPASDGARRGSDQNTFPHELVTYAFPLRQDVQITISLPTDFREREVERVKAWVQTLALAEEKAN